MPSFIALKNTVISLELLRKIICLPHSFWGGLGGESEVQKCHIFGIQMFCHEKQYLMALEVSVCYLSLLSSDMTSKTYM